MAIVAFVLVACSQASLAGHQFEHDADSAVEVCGICVGLQSDAGPPPPAESVFPEFRPSAYTPPQSVFDAPFEGSRAHPARGPPLNG